MQNGVQCKQVIIIENVSVNGSLSSWRTLCLGFISDRLSTVKSSQQPKQPGRLTDTTELDAERLHFNEDVLSTHNITHRIGVIWHKTN